ncbi:hypothetical protein ACMZ6Z_09245 [Streptococcus pluranimalium]|uniref:hypothetical protein n=1 Tax=Streptococcus pluranimalium TaxID=82348 RepID=UPI0039FC4A39
MEKLNAHINETGLNPFTGKPATEGEKFVAQHYGWVKSSSTTIATMSAGVSDWSDLMVDIARGRLGRMINEVPTHNLTVE